MQLTQSPKFNRNYAAKIVEIKDFIKHPNPKCERLKCCTIDGYSIAVSIDTNPIGEKVIKATWRRYRDFIIQEDIKSMLKKSPKHVDGGRPVILVDMDATLCLNTTGRPYFGEGAAEGMLDDIAIEGTCMLVRRMYEKCKVFIVTGREGTPEIIAATKKWLAKHDVVVDELFFRPVKDYSPGADCKKKIYEDNIKGKYNVQFVLEDNYKCVKMWREQGLVCLQPNEGKF